MRLVNLRKLTWSLCGLGELRDHQKTNLIAGLTTKNVWIVSIMQLFTSFFFFFFVNSILNKVDVFWHEHLLLLSKYKTLVVKSKYVFGDRDQVITKNANIISRSQITVNMDFHKHFHLILSNVIFRRFACTWYCWYHSWCRGYSNSLCHLSYLQVYNIDHHNISWHYY